MPGGEGGQPQSNESSPLDGIDLQPQASDAWQSLANDFARIDRCLATARGI
jgi:hypothetical protein